MVKAGYMTGDESGEKLDWLKRVVATAQTQVDYGAQVPEKVALYFTDDFDFENEEAVSVLKEETVPLVMKALIEGFHSLDELNHDSVKGVFKAVQKGTN